MNLLAFDTSTDALSIAVGSRLGSPNEQVWAHSGAGGAQASTSLLPAIRTLMLQAGLRFDELDAICFGAGPGSFTGLRTACAVAQGLGFATGRPVLPVHSLMAVAEEARGHMGLPPHCRVLAMLDARMDEVYAAYFEFDSKQWLSDMPQALVKPEDLPAPSPSTRNNTAWTPAGNAFAAYGQRLPAHASAMPPVLAFPTASAMLRLAPALLAAGLAVPAAQAMPVYVRDKVAQTTDERAALRAAAAPAKP